MSLEVQEHRSPLLKILPADLIPTLARPMTSPLGVWAANRAQWRRGQSERSGQPRTEPYAAANFLLDAIPNWRKTYLPGGLIQHQSFIPHDAALAAFREILERSHTAGIVPSLSVLKKHRAADEYLVNYLVDGYSLALDYPVRRGEEERIMRLMRTLNDVVANYGGRLYFAKDSTATAEQVRRMLSADRLERFRALKWQYDARGVFSTDLYRRALA
jgi:FAD/FMN-containing dehydrogenase